MWYLRLLLKSCLTVLTATVVAAAIFALARVAPAVVPSPEFLLTSGGFQEFMQKGGIFPLWNPAANQGLGAPSFALVPPLPYWTHALAEMARSELFSLVRAAASYQFVLLLVSSFAALALWGLVQLTPRGQRRPVDASLISEFFLYCLFAFGAVLSANRYGDPIVMAMALAGVSWGLGVTLRNWNHSRFWDAIEASLAWAVVGLTTGLPGLAFGAIVNIGFFALALANAQQRIARITYSVAVLVSAAMLTGFFWAPLITEWPYLKEALGTSALQMSLGLDAKALFLSLTCVGVSYGLAHSVVRGAMKAGMSLETFPVSIQVFPRSLVYLTLVLTSGLATFRLMQVYPPNFASAVNKGAAIGAAKYQPKILSGRVDIDCRWQKKDQLDCDAFAVHKSRIAFDLTDYPGWTLRIDRKIEQPADQNVVALTPGPHRVQWLLEPTHLRSLSRSVSGVWFALALIVLPNRPGRRRSAK